MRKRAVCAVYLCFSFLFFELHAQNVSADVATATEHIYNFRFKSADTLVIKLLNTDSNNYQVNLLAANYQWWMIITGEDSDSVRNKYQKHLDKAIYLIKSATKFEDDNEKLYCLILAYAYKGRLNALNKNYLKAISDLNTCMDYLKRSFGKENSYDWFYLSSGLYNYYIEYWKKNYPVFYPYLVTMPAGNKKTGLEMLLNGLLSSENILATESRYFLMKLFLEYELSFDEASRNNSFLLKKYPSNLLYRYYQSNVQCMKNEINEAQAELQTMQNIAAGNTQLTAKQKNHLVKLAEEDIQKAEKSRK
jgi:hypothetical protein